eukprot:scaffold15022_cov120-Skeletonema_dohrnii-CCMP3373.AAC.2
MERKEGTTRLQYGKWVHTAKDILIGVHMLRCRKDKKSDSFYVELANIGGHPCPIFNLRFEEKYVTGPKQR